MDNFLDIIQEELAQKRTWESIDHPLTFEEKLLKISPKLHKIAKYLQKLVDSKALLESGDFFQYHLGYRPNADYCLEMDFRGLKAQIYDTATNYNAAYALDELYTSVNTTQVIRSKEEAVFIEKLAHYLGQKLGSLGLLDKQIYSKEAQDHLGI